MCSQTAGEFYGSCSHKYALSSEKTNLSQTSCGQGQDDVGISQCAMDGSKFTARWLADISAH